MGNTAGFTLVLILFSSMAGDGKTITSVTVNYKGGDGGYFTALDHSEQKGFTFVKYLLVFMVIM